MASPVIASRSRRGGRSLGGGGRRGRRRGLGRGRHGRGGLGRRAGGGRGGGRGRGLRLRVHGQELRVGLGEVVQVVREVGGRELVLRRHVDAHRGARVGAQVAVAA